MIRPFKKSEKPGKQRRGSKAEIYIKRTKKDERVGWSKTLCRIPECGKAFIPESKVWSLGFRL